jgi:predicted aspartyl protease
MNRTRTRVGSAWLAAAIVLGPWGRVAAGDTPASARACAAARAPTAAFQMQVPFETIDGRIYVQARVNGRGPFRFAIDTGASGVGRVDASLVATLELTLGAPTANSDGVTTAEAETTMVETIEVGGLSRRDLRVITRDYNSRMAPASALSGIIAREFFADGLLVIDYPRRLLSFGSGLSLSPEQPGVLRYTRPFRVPVTIGAVTAEGNLDTGANVAFVLPQALFDRVSGTPAAPAARGQLANGTVDTSRATVPGPFRIGEVTLSDVEVHVSARYPELLVGAHALQGAVVLIDQRSQRIAVCP